MKINFTNREFAALFDMVSIAEWVLNAHLTDESDDDYAAVEQKILSHAKDFGLEDYVQSDHSHGRLYPTRDYEESEQFMGAIERYNERTFWDALVTRLAERDMIQRFGEGEFGALPVEERMSLLSAREADYAREFEVNGLAALRLVSGLSSHGPNPNREQPDKGGTSGT